jgi:hypothetical protein
VASSIAVSSAYYIPLLLANTGMHCGAGEVALSQELVKLGAAQSGSYEDDDLVELKHIKKVVKLPILFAFIKLHVVLLKTVESQLLLVINVDLQRILHELFADYARVLGKSG